MLRVLRSSSFWLPFLVTAMVVGIFFAWELGYLRDVLPSIPRSPAMTWELMFTWFLGLLLSFNTGLAVWQSREGSCPAGMKRVTGFAGFIGALTLICPACILLPASLIGVGFFFAFIGPYLPFIRIVALLLLLAATWMLWPKQTKRRKS